MRRLSGGSAFFFLHDNVLMMGMVITYAVSAAIIQKMGWFDTMNGEVVYKNPVCSAYVPSKEGVAMLTKYLRMGESDVYK